VRDGETEKVREDEYAATGVVRDKNREEHTPFHTQKGEVEAEQKMNSNSLPGPQSLKRREQSLRRESFLG